MLIALYSTHSLSKLPEHCLCARRGAHGHSSHSERHGTNKGSRSNRTRAMRPYTGQGLTARAMDPPRDDGICLENWVLKDKCLLGCVRWESPLCSSTRLKHRGQKQEKGGRYGRKGRVWTDLERTSGPFVG